jgi:predicted O-methyltransferase YrrM
VALLRIPNDVLREMYETSRTIAADGSKIPLHSVVVPESANSLYQLVKRERPTLVLEVGMAQGATALAIVTALAENGSGRLISIDPHQQTRWGGAAVAALERSGLQHLHQLVEAPDYIALPDLLRELGRTVGLAYVDGLHSYEYVLLDFFYIDQILRVGGVVGFNDCDWPAVIPTLRFIQEHRHYEAVDVGLAPAYGTRNEAVRKYLRAEARLLRGSARPSSVRPVARLLGRRREDRYFRKKDTWEPAEGWMPRRWSL